MNKRQFRRVSYNANTQIEFEGKHLDVTLLNVSLHGVLLESEAAAQRLSIEDLILVRIRLNQSSVALEIKTRVIRIFDHCLGCKFVEMDLDSMIHLRSLIDFNQEDLENTEHELQYLLQEDQS
jgi:hypothetical protein